MHSVEVVQGCISRSFIGYCKYAPVLDENVFINQHAIAGMYRAIGNACLHAAQNTSNTINNQGASLSIFQEASACRLY